eukprot:COSAG01_NODE_24667_length_771_cov_0.919643_1_plen_137_part_01
MRAHEDPDLMDKWNPQDKCKFVWPCDNGLFDLDANEFRPAHIDEMILYTCGWNWEERTAEYMDDNGDMRTFENDMQDVKQFHREVCDTDEQCQYKLVKFAACLLGFNRWQEFLMLTGKGANGKSTEITHLSNVFKNL